MEKQTWEHDKVEYNGEIITLEGVNGLWIYGLPSSIRQMTARNTEHTTKEVAITNAKEIIDAVKNRR